MEAEQRERQVSHFKYNPVVKPQPPTCLTGSPIRIPLYPPQLHKVEGGWEGAILRVVLHGFLVVQDLSGRESIWNSEKEKKTIKKKYYN